MGLSSPPRADQPYVRLQLETERGIQDATRVMRTARDHQLAGVACKSCACAIRYYQRRRLRWCGSHFQGSFLPRHHETNRKEEENAQKTFFPVDSHLDSLCAHATPLRYQRESAGSARTSFFGFIKVQTSLMSESITFSLLALMNRQPFADVELFHQRRRAKVSWTLSNCVFVIKMKNYILTRKSLGWEAAVGVRLSQDECVYDSGVEFDGFRLNWVLIRVCWKSWIEFFAACLMSSIKPMNGLSD